MQIEHENDQLLFGESEQEYLARRGLAPASDRDVSALLSKIRSDYEAEDTRAGQIKAFDLAASLRTGTILSELRKAAITMGGTGYGSNFTIEIGSERYEVSVKRVAERDLDAEARARAMAGERAPDPYYRWLR